MKKILVLEPKANDGVFWYRIEQFSRLARQKKDFDIQYLDPYLPEDKLYKVFALADAFFFHIANRAPQILLKETGFPKHKPVIIDCDDNYHLTNPFSNMYETYGIKEVILQDGTYLWKDGQANFSIEKNKQRLKEMEELFSKATIITTTTFKMKEYLENYNKKVAIIPNCLNKKYFPCIEKKDDRIVKIGWTGGSSHFEDIYSILPSLKKIMEKYPHVHYYHIGQWFGVVEKYIPKERLHTYGWINADGHGYRQACLNLDIGLCPLTEHEFNQYKSSIKFYEYSATKTATLAYNSLPYNEDIKEGETGYLYSTIDEFEKKLEFLIFNPVKRRLVAQNAYDWVWENRDIEKIYEDWKYLLNEVIKTYENIIRKPTS